MGQNRNAPAYQEYAAAILAQLPFRTMTLQDRGLFFTMRLECWVNIRLPQNHADLAKVLGLPVAEIAESLEAVMPFFESVDGYVISPELENYRAHLAERKSKQSQGGKIGSAITNRKRDHAACHATEEVPSATPSTSRLTRRGGRVSLVQSSTEKPSPQQSSETGGNQFVSDYEAAESCSANAYAQASGSRHVVVSKT
ncbi:MAG: hypothetical protein C0406_10390 [Sideroxydans sp.]|nr:hypothetical protein [Sideroxydans sp.]